MHHSDPAQERYRAQIRELATQLYRDERGRLLAIARRNSDASVDIEAVLHDAFLSFLEHYDPRSEAPPIGWLSLTLKRRCWALHKRQRFEQPPIHGDVTDRFDTNQAPRTEIDPFRLLADREEARSGLGRTKPHERRAISLLALGYSYREICQQTGWTYTKVRRCIYEGRLALRGGDGVS